MTDPASDFQQFSRAIHAQARLTHTPVNAHFELTNRCNLTCRMCYIRCEAADREARRQELTVADWVRLAEAAKAAGTLFLSLTGGEILLRPDFLEIYTPLAQMGFILTLYTNGTLLTPALVRAIAKLPPHRVDITLYGASPATYARVTGDPAGFTRAMAGIDLLCDAGIPPGIKVTLTRWNFADYPAICALAEARGLPVKKGWLLTNRRDGLPSEVREARLTPDEVLAIYPDMTPREPAVRREALTCAAGRSSYSITMDGCMLPCVDFACTEVRPLEIGFQAAWERTRRTVEQVTVAPACAACDLAAYCTICPAQHQLATGSLTTPDPEQCAFLRCLVTHAAATP